MSDQTSIIGDLGVAVTFNAAIELERRISFLKEYLLTTGLRFFVLGISGGVDSTTAAMLAQRAVRDLREAGHMVGFVAVRLPYGQQADEVDAQAALAAIGPDHLYTMNIKPAADAMLAEAKAAGLAFSGSAHEDFILGNIKARQRMIAQYTLAGALGGLVIGTDHAAEAVMGFFTKFGDGAADILPLSGLNKRRVRAIASLLGVPDRLVFKVPTADLENNAPLRPDEDAYGVTYEQIDDFLEGKPIDVAAQARIIQAYRATSHKRAMPLAASAVSP